MFLCKAKRNNNRSKAMLGLENKDIKVKRHKYVKLQNIQSHLND